MLTVRKLSVGAVLLILLGLAGMVLALGPASTSGSWINPQGDNGQPSCIRYGTLPDGENVLLYASLDGPVCPDEADPDRQSGFGFLGNSGLNVVANEIILLGEFTHYNNPMPFYDGYSFLKQADLMVGLRFDAG
jgi:hypothetical protein